jgi:hypothetical protein
MWVAKRIADHYDMLVEQRKGEALPGPLITAEGTFAGRQPQRPSAGIS